MNMVASPSWLPSIFIATITVCRNSEATGLIILSGLAMVSVFNNKIELLRESIDFLFSSADWCG